jgi:predicted ATPase
MELQASDLFRALRNAYKAGLLEQKPETEYEYVPGKRYFESMKESLLKSVIQGWVAKLEIATPLIRFLAEEDNWRPAEIHTSDVFKALRNAYKAGLLEQKTETEYEYVPGKRYFESFKAAILEKGVGELANNLSVAVPVIRFLADEKNWHIDQENR